jgi:DNA-binding NarL/FixJ family response regulator
MMIGSTTRIVHTEPATPEVRRTEDSPTTASPSRLRALILDGCPGDALVTLDRLRDAGDHIDCEIAATLQEVSDDRLAGVDCVLIEPAGVDAAGLQALQALQALHDRAPDVPVVVLTRTQDPETGLESLRRGAQDYLVKSRTDADTLARAIRFAVVRQRLQAVQRRRSAQDRELHDDVIQQLFAIGVAMQTTERRSVDQPGIADRIADHLNGLHRVLRQVRSTLGDTEPEP